MADSRNLSRIITAGIFLLLVVSWIIKAMSGMETDSWLNIRNGALTTIAAFLTLCIYSFLYGDNPFYRFAEHLFVGVSAAYWMTLGFWSTIVGNVVPRSFPALAKFFKISFNYELGTAWHFIVPLILGILLLMRLAPKMSWISRWPLAFIIGTTAGLNLPRYLQSDFIQQINNTFITLLPGWQGVGPFFSHLSLSASGQLVMISTNVVVFVGVVCGLIYFFFSKEHRGWFGVASRIGIWVLMLTFGASFGYTVMGRISLLVGRITFLFHDWLGIL